MKTEPFDLACSMLTRRKIANSIGWAYLGCIPAFRT